MMELKYSGKRFGQMEPVEITVNAKEVLLRVHVIAGWAFPSDELVGILMDEFSQKVVESYPDVTKEEICFAFRSGASQVKEWGKALNIGLIDEVMIPYLEKRREISKIEEQKKQIEYKPDLEQIEKEYQEFLQTDLGKKLDPNKNSQWKNYRMK